MNETFQTKRVGVRGRLLWITVAGLVVCTCVLSPISAGGRAPGEIAVVAHRDVSLDQVSRIELRRLFMAVSSEVQGVRLKPLHLAHPEFKQWFLETLTGQDLAEVEDHFVQIELRGEGQWPPEVESTSELIKLIVGNRHIIGWLPVEELEGLSERQRSAIKVLAIDGSPPGGTSYLLSP